jgi:steroid Delta-isomerase
VPVSRGRIVEAVEGYLDAVRRSDVDGILSHYASGASVEDPIGSEPMTGPAIREFYSRPRKVRFLERLGVIAVAGSYAGFAFHLELERSEGVLHVYVHETMRFDDDGKVVSMVALPDFELREVIPTAFPASRGADA